MTDYTWNGLVSTDASVAGNWTPSGIPTTGDKAIFDSTGARPCNFNITALDEIEIQSDNINLITFTVDVDLIGLSVSAEGTMVATAPRGMTFSGTPLYKSGSCYIEIGTSSNPFSDAISRGHFTFTLTPSTGDIYFDTGIYPNIKLGGSGGNFTPQYVAPTVADSTDVHFLTMIIATSGTFGPASATPTDNDKAKNFILDSSLSQFTIVPLSITAFDGGYATWTFQGASAGFLIPTSNLATYQGCNFTFQKMSIVATDAGAGAWAKIAANARLYLTDFTVGVGASVKGAGPSAIHLINRPTIKGTWGFFPIADGIYHHKDGEVLGVANGGTGLSNIGQYEIPFGSEGNSLTTSSLLTFDNNANELTIDGKLTVSGLIDPTGMVFTPQATNPEATNPQDTIWISNEDGHLYRGNRDVESTVHFNVRNDEGSTIPLGAPLYSRGEIGGSNRIKVGIADAGDPNKMPCIGLAMVEMNTTSTKDGNMILSGIFNENITITGVAEGDILYLAPHGGSTPYLTTTRPTGASHLIQNVGICVRQAAINVCQGMTVSAIGRTNDSPNCSFLMVNTESTHPQARRLVAGTNITLTDGGAGGDLTIAASGGGGGTYTDAQAIAAVEGEATLDLTGDVSLAANKELTINESTYSSSSKNSDDTKVLVSADSTGTNDALFRVDTDAGFLRMGPQNTGYCHFYTDRTAFYFNRNIEMDGGSFQAYNDDLQILTTTTTAEATRIFIDAGVDECRVGIGNGFSASFLPEHTLHVKGEGNFPFRVQADEGNLRMNRFGHLQIQNDNTVPLDGETIDSPLWQIGQRDGGQLDIAFGALSTQLVAASDALLTLQRGSATGPKQIGFLGASPTAAIDDGAGSPLTPITPALVMPSPNESTLAARLDAILAGLQQLGLFA